MKTLLTIVLILFTLSMSAQIMIKDKPKSTAGIELKKASNQFYTGFFMTIGGAAITYATRNHVDRTLPQAGVLISSIGIIVNITSWIHINKAGKLLDNKVTASLTANGLKLNIKI